jgi:methyltransferase-like protein
VGAQFFHADLPEIRKRKANWIGHILRRNCLLKQGIEGKIQGKIEVTRRRGRRRKKLLDDLGDRKGYSHLKEEALDRIKWRNRLEEALGLSCDRLLMMMMMDGQTDEANRQHFTPTDLIILHQTKEKWRERGRKI